MFNLRYIELTRHQATLLGLVRTAWDQNPSLAVQLVARFPSTRLLNDVRFLVLNFPEKALSEPEAVQLLLGSALPADLSFQLKVCSTIPFSYLVLTSTVPPVLGSRQSNNSCNLLLTGLS